MKKLLCILVAISAAFGASASKSLTAGAAVPDEISSGVGGAAQTQDPHELEVS